MGKGVEEEIGNTPQLDRTGEKKNWWNPLNRSKRGSTMESVWIRGRRKINGDYFPLINRPICPELQRGEDQIT